MTEVPLLAVGIGDIKIGKGPALVRTNLGSCVGVCLYHSGSKVGGMLHCMLPFADEYRDKPGFRAAKYADSGIDELITGLKKMYGIEPKTLTAKIFGGASVLKNISLNIGQTNEQSVRSVLKNLHIPIVAAKTGGEKGYQIDFDLEDGSVLCRVFGQETQEY